MSSSPPPNPSATPPASSTTPSPPSSPPPVPVAPPPSTPAPPPVSPPPPAANSPPPATTPPPPVPSSSPPPSASPPPPVLSPPPSAAPPPPSVSSTPPATPNAPPPSSPSPPASRPPPSATPPAASSPPPPPPSAKPRKSPPSLPPPNNTSSPPSSPPGNSTGGTTPNIPRLSPPFPITPPGSTLTPARPRFNAPSAPGSDVRSGNRNPEGGGGGDFKTGHVVAIGLVAALVVLGIAGLAVFFLRKRKKPITGYNAGFVIPSPFASSIMSDSSFPRSPPSAPLVHHHKSESVRTMNSLPETAISSSTQWFSYEELYDITNGFSPQNILGEGGFGSVYKGCLPDGREVAVKRLKVGSGQGDREFKAEVEIISRIHHRHLVSLVGYCISDNQRMLVYDYVPNGTLESHLHGKGRPVMDWATRLKVAAGAAHGIAYLHEDCHPRIIHRDIKSSNILLDNNFEAQVSDFGLARLALDACTHVTTRVMGTFGYLAPEYASSGKLTEKSDVFSFGVVLLELITGRKPVDSTRPLGDESLVEWARPLLSRALETGELGELPDSRLENNYNKIEMFRIIESAAACTRHSAAMRPQMGKVVRVLDSLADIDLSNGVTPGQSEVFNVAHSADIRIFQQLAFGGHDSSSDYGQYYWSHQSDM